MHIATFSLIVYTYIKLMKAEHYLLLPVSVACLPGLESKGFAGGDNLKPMSHVWIIHHLHSHALQRYPLNHLHTQMERERGRGGEREERERERERGRGNKGYSIDQIKPVHIRLH